MPKFQLGIIQNQKTNPQSNTWKPKRVIIYMYVNLTREGEWNLGVCFKSDTNEDLVECTWKQKGYNNPQEIEDHVILEALQAPTHMQTIYMTIFTNCKAMV